MQRDLKVEIKKLMEANHYVLRLGSDSISNYVMEELSILSVEKGDFSKGNHQFSGQCKIGIPNDNGTPFGNYHIEGKASVSDDEITIIEPICIREKYKNI